MLFYCSLVFIKCMNKNVLLGFQSSSKFISVEVIFYSFTRNLNDVVVHANFLALFCLSCCVNEFYFYIEISRSEKKIFLLFLYLIVLAWLSLKIALLVIYTSSNTLCKLVLHVL